MINLIFKLSIHVISNSLNNAKCSLFQRTGDVFGYNLFDTFHAEAGVALLGCLGLISGQVQI